MKKILCSIAYIVIAIALRSTPCSAQNNPPAEGHYANVHDLKLFYLDKGKGLPLVLLHGGLSTIDHDFGAMIPELEKTHRVIAVEMQGHGHTKDIDRPLSYASMASDVLELLQTLHIEKADFLGYSMGGGVVLQIAIIKPAIVNHIVLMSTAYSPLGMNFDNPGNLRPKPAEDLNRSEFKKAYDAVAPDTSQWQTLVKKNFALMESWKGFDTADIRRINAPVFLLFGDADISKPEHAVEMFRLRGGGIAGDLYELPNEQLAVIPGTTHVQMPKRAGWILPMITGFLQTTRYRAAHK